MTYWAILLITYGHPEFVGQVSPIPFASYSACGDALETMADLLLDVDPEVMVQCIDTTLPSGSPRPKPRPADLMEGRL